MLVKLTFQVLFLRWPTTHRNNYTHAHTHTRALFLSRSFSPFISLSLSLAHLRRENKELRASLSFGGKNKPRAFFSFRWKQLRAPCFSRGSPFFQVKGEREREREVRGALDSKNNKKQKTLTNGVPYSVSLSLSFIHFKRVDPINGHPITH